MRLIRNSLLLILSLAAASPLCAQIVTGRVLIDVVPAQPLAGADVVVQQDSLMQRAATDQHGRFRFVLRPGKFQVTVKAIGFAETTSGIIDIKASERVLLDVTASPSPAVLEPIVVRARQTIKTGRYGFDYRKERGSKTGMGIFLDEKDLAHSSAIFVSDALRRFPALRNTMVNQTPHSRGATTFSGTPYGAQRLDGRGCGGYKYYVNGSPTRLKSEEVDGMFDLSEIKGIEVYRRADEVPGEFGNGEGCPVIAIWTN